MGDFMPHVLVLTQVCARWHIPPVAQVIVLLHQLAWLEFGHVWTYLVFLCGLLKVSP